MPWFWFMNTWVISALLLRPGCSRHDVSVHCLCVYILSFYATGWPLLPKCMHLTLVCWCVASMLCCHCWMLSLTDALSMRSYPSEVWVLRQCGRADLCAAQLICFLPISFSTWNRWYIMANTEDVDFIVVKCSFYSNVHFTSWIWFSAYGWLYKLWDMLFLFDLAFVWPSLGRADFHSA